MFFHKQELQYTAPVPSNFPRSNENTDVEYQFINCSDGAPAREGSWATGPTPDGVGTFSYEDAPFPKQTVPFPAPTEPDERHDGTTPLPNLVEKAAGAVKDAVTKK